MTKPRHDPQLPLMPHNPCIRGALHKPESDSKSLLDHLAPTRLDAGTHPLRGNRHGPQTTYPDPFPAPVVDDDP